MTLDIISNYSFNSKKDIVSFLNNHSEVDFKVSEIEGVISTYGVKTIEKFPQIGPLIGQIYTGILGLAPSLGMVEVLDASQQVCEEYLRTSRQEIRPLVLAALNCHRVALDHCANQSLEAATKEMMKVRDFAGQIGNIYKRLSEHFDSLLGSFTRDRLMMIHGYRITFCHRIKELDSQERTAQQNACMAAYTWAADELDQTIEMAWKVRRLFTSARQLYYEQYARYSSSLYSAARDLESVSTVKYRLQVEKNRPQTDLIDLPIGWISLRVKESVTLGEVVSSMKTGNPLFLEQPSEAKQEDFLTVRETFEMSFLKWLTVAKISFDCGHIFKETIVAIEKAKQGIAWTHKDPLAIALSSSPLLP